MISEVRVYKLFIPQSNSLKRKRGTVKPIIERLKNRFNVSVIELSGNDVWQRADIAVSLLSNDREQAENELREIEKFIEFSGEVLITDVTKSPYE